ncbi:hypothetical protein Bbelb_150970 [Branchiostoma belcheri]|nr:hypothetical protein Bbelb_150970 [Branchiostoma belcheri]
MEELCRAPPWRLLVQPSALQSSSMEVARAALRDTPAELCAKTKRKEVKVKLNGDANQRIDFIWRRALRVSQTDGELSEQSCAELHRKEVKAKLNGDANQRIDFIWRRALRVSQTDGELSEQSCAEALRGYRGGLHEQPPWRSSAELRAERATSMEELCRAPPWS